MSDVGDAVELTFTTKTGATVTATWLNPAGVAVVENAPVTESPAASGAFPYSFLGTSPGIWSAIFTASGAADAVERYDIRFNAVTGIASLATVTEFEELFRPLTAAEHALVRALLRRASGMIRSRFTDVDDRIADGTLDAGQAAMAAINMVLRVMRNPQALKSEATGPFRREFNPATAGGYLSLTGAETDLLAPPVADGAAAVGAATIRVVAGLAPPSTTGWCGVSRW